MCNISNKYWQPSFILGKNWRSPLQNLLETPTFYHSFTSFSQEICNVSNKYWYPSKILIFLHTKLDIYLSLTKPIGALHRKCFTKNPLFITLSLFLIVTKVWYISNNYWIPKKSVKNIFTQVALHPLFISKRMLISMVVFSRNIHFLPYFY